MKEKEDRLIIEENDKVEELLQTSTLPPHTIYKVLLINGDTFCACKEPNIIPEGKESPPDPSYHKIDRETAKKISKYKYANPKIWIFEEVTKPYEGDYPPDECVI